ncbi:MAG: hypothetical protein LJF30_06600 [Acidobacteria bacterium]|jgi:hypothetical protein|nr:hypothetical protein [Acidobacteriota bacterium]
MSPKKSKAKPKKATPKKKAAKARAVKKKAVKARAARKKAAKKAVKARAGKKAAKKAVKARAGKKAAKKAARPKSTTTRTAAKKSTAKSKAAARAAAAKPVVVKPAPAPPDAPKRKKARSRRRSSRRAIIRRGPDGEILAPGDLLLPGGPKGEEEIQYMFRGCMAAEHPVAEDAVNEVLTKRGVPEGPGEREELQNTIEWAQERFGGGDVEPIIPIRSNLRKTFQGVVDRARQRRREIGAFLRGLDMGQTETSHMDAHGEASLQSLMEWAARLESLVENLAETPEMNQAHYTQFHRVLDQLEATTEALVIDVEQTLRRLRDRLEH